MKKEMWPVWDLEGEIAALFPTEAQAHDYEEDWNLVGDQALLVDIPEGET